MPNVNNWTNSLISARGFVGGIEGNNRAISYTDKVIKDKPSTIVISRVDGTTLSPQTVRIEQTRIQPDKDVGRSGREVNANAVLIGYKGHPDIADTDVRVGDKFVLNGKRFEIRFIQPETVGFVEAWLEVIG